MINVKNQVIFIISIENVSNNKNVVMIRTIL